MRKNSSSKKTSAKASAYPKILKDNERIYIQISARTTTGSFLPKNAKRIAKSANVVTSGRVQLSLENLKDILLRYKDDLPKEISNSVLSLFNGNCPNIFDARESRKIVLCFSSRGTCEASWAAELYELFTNKMNLIVPWAVTVSKPPYTLLMADSRTFEKDDGEMRKAAYIPEDIADLLYLRGTNDELTLPREREELDLALTKALHSLYGEKACGQGRPVKERVQAILDESDGALSTCAKKMLPHYKSIVALLERECLRQNKLAPLPSEQYKSVKQFTRDDIGNIVGCSFTESVAIHIAKSQHTGLMEIVGHIKSGQKPQEKASLRI
jgi:hypothetical protein